MYVFIFMSYLIIKVFYNFLIPFGKITSIASHYTRQYKYNLVNCYKNRTLSAFVWVLIGQHRFFAKTLKCAKSIYKQTLKCSSIEDYLQAI